MQRLIPHPAQSPIFNWLLFSLLSLCSTPDSCAHPTHAGALCNHTSIPFIPVDLLPPACRYLTPTTIPLAADNPMHPCPAPNLARPTQPASLSPQRIRARRGGVHALSFKAYASVRSRVRTSSTYTPNCPGRWPACRCFDALHHIRIRPRGTLHYARWSACVVVHSAGLACVDLP